MNNQRDIIFDLNFKVGILSLTERKNKNKLSLYD